MQNLRDVSSVVVAQADALRQNSGRHLVCKVYRRLFFYADRLRSLLTLLHLKLKYPTLQADWQTYIGRQCTIISTDSSRMILTRAVIRDRVVLVSDFGGVLTINDSSVGYGSVIVAHEKINIEEKCSIAEMVVIRDQNHGYGKQGALIEEQGFETSPIYISRNVWIGSKASVLKGVTIGENAVIAASAVITKNVPAEEVWGGIPARLLKKIHPA
jgi:acetyltransferase-like isoleucine patch superfamily enzyme